ncbi:hypothetical protein KJ564_12955, partial [bacterium]|nr:hypothetical protein [bacterium]
FNDVNFHWENTVTYCDFFDCVVNYWSSQQLPGFGELVTVNLNGDSCDVYSNIFQDPLFVGGEDYNLTEDSPCIDAGDPY